MFKVESGTYNDTLITRFKDQFADTLEIAKADKINILLNKAFTVSANTPLALINPELISVVDKDTLNIPFEASLDTIKNTVNINFEPTESNRYQITFLPEAITDFFNATNDSLSYSVPTKEFSDYGDLFLTVQNVKSYPIIAQLLNNKGEVIYEKYANLKNYSFIIFIDDLSFEKIDSDYKIIKSTLDGSIQNQSTGPKTRSRFCLSTNLCGLGSSCPSPAAFPRVGPEPVGVGQLTPGCRRWGK